MFCRYGLKFLLRGTNSKQTKYLLTLTLQAHWLPEITNMVPQNFPCQRIKAEDPYRHQPTILIPSRYNYLAALSFLYGVPPTGEDASPS